MIVTNKNKKLVIKLTTNITTPLRLKYKRNGEWVSYIESTATDGVVTWTIPFNAMNIGDELTSFTLYQYGNTSLSNTNEGITWLIDGEVEANTHKNNWVTKFQDNKEHTIQAVFKGNELYSMSATTPRMFFVEQPTTDHYKLEFVDKLTSFDYQDGKEIIVRLTNGGEPVVGETVEITTPWGVFSYTTRTDGTVSTFNNDWSSGDYTIRAFFYLQNTMRAMVEKKITIKKGDITVTVPDTIYTKGQRMKLNFKTPNGSNLTNAPISVYINGKLYSYKTNSSGNIWITFAHMGTFNFNVVYNGNKSLKAKKVQFRKWITQ